MSLFKKSDKHSDIDDISDVRPQNPLLEDNLVNEKDINKKDNPKKGKIFKWLSLCSFILFTFICVGILTSSVGSILTENTVFNIALYAIIACISLLLFVRRTSQAVKKANDDAQKTIQDFKSSLSGEENEYLSLVERSRLLSSEIENKELDKRNLEEELSAIALNIENEKKELNELTLEVEAKQVELDDSAICLEYGIYKPQFKFASSSDFKDELKKTREKEKNAAKKLNDAPLPYMRKEIPKSAITDLKKLIIRSYNDEMDKVINAVKTTNINASIDKARSRAKGLSNLVKAFEISIPDSYIKLKIKEMRLAYEYAKFKEEEAEAIREARALEREEKKLQQEIAAKRKLLMKEQKQYLTALQNAIAQYEAADDEEEKAAISAKLEELREKVEDVDKAIEDVDYRQANQRAGYVYIISNIGSFGENVYKIGMTRRLEPLERIYELSDASVPFNFDVHALIFCDDAPALENALHREFEDRKVNLINHRREFFNVTLEEIEEVVKRNFDKTVDFVEVPEAEQYRESIKMRELGLDDV